VPPAAQLLRDDPDARRGQVIAVAQVPPAAQRHRNHSVPATAAALEALPRRLGLICGSDSQHRCRTLVTPGDSFRASQPPGITVAVLFIEFGGESLLGNQRRRLQAGPDT
jgi:hypothetical protein